MKERHSRLGLESKEPVVATMVLISLLAPGGKRAADEASESGCCRAESDVTVH